MCKIVYLTSRCLDTPSRYFRDALADEFEEYYTKNRNEHLSEEIIFEIIRNAFMIDYYQNIKEF